MFSWKTTLKTSNTIRPKKLEIHQKQNTGISNNKRQERSTGKSLLRFDFYPKLNNSNQFFTFASFKAIFVDINSSSNLIIILSFIYSLSLGPIDRVSIRSPTSFLRRIISLLHYWTNSSSFPLSFKWIFSSYTLKSSFFTFFSSSEL